MLRRRGERASDAGLLRSSAVTDAQRPCAGRNGRQSRPLSRSSLPSALKQSAAWPRAPPRTRTFLPRRASSRRRARKARSRARATSATSPPSPAAARALVAAAPRVSAWLRESLARSLRFDGAQALRDDAMTAQLLGWTTTLLWAVVPFGMAMVGLRDRQRAGDGRLDLDLEAARPEVPRPRPARRPRPRVLQAAGRSTR